MDTISVWEYEEQPDRAFNDVPAPLSKPQRAILEALSTFHYLTAEQLSRYLGVSLRYTQLHCQRLTENGYLLALTPSKQVRFGGVPYVFTLGRRGRAHLTHEGIAVKKRYRPSEEQRRRGAPLLHTLAVNEVLLNAHLLGRTESVRLRGFVHEREFDTDPLQVPLREDSKESVVSLRPDLWLDFAAFGARFCFCIEVNLTPVEQKRWRRKIRSYLHSIPAYRARFGTEALIVATFVETGLNFPKTTKTTLTPTEEAKRAEMERSRVKRLADLLHWTESELKEQGAMSAADRFLFSTSNVNVLSPVELFLSNHFRMPGAETIEPLIPSKKEGYIS